MSTVKACPNVSDYRLAEEGAGRHRILDDVTGSRNEVFQTEAGSQNLVRGSKESLLLAG